MSGQVDREMKYPYTLTAKLRQFPYKYHFNNLWMFRYYLYAVGVSTPLFLYFHRLANSPANVAKYEEFKRKEAAEHAAHAEHLK